MTDKPAFKKAIGYALTSNGFRKKGQNWYLHSPECTIVLNLQKDDVSDLYYINFGLWLSLFGEAPYPQENHCHVRARLERIFPAQRELIFDACTIGLDDSHLAHFIDFLSSDVVPLCRRCLTVTGLKEEIERGRIPHYNVIRVARPLLGLPERT